MTLPVTHPYIEPTPGVIKQNHLSQRARHAHLEDLHLPVVQLGDKNILFLVIQLQLKTITLIHS